MAYDDDSPYPTSPYPMPGAPQEQPNTPPVTTLPYEVPAGTNPTPVPGAPVPNNNGFNWGSFLQNLVSGGAGGMNFGSLLPGLASAWQQWDNAGRYGDLGREAASMASPVDQATRQRYQQRLEQYYTDPEKFLEGNPEYQAQMRLGGAKVAARNNARGLGDSGKAFNDQMRFMSDLGAQYLGKERDDLMQMGGFQFDPGNSARMLMEGGKLENDARTSALASMIYGLNGPSAGQVNGDGGGGGILSQIANMFKNGGAGAQQSLPILQQIISQGGQAGISLAKDLLSKGISTIQGADGATIDLGGYLRMGGQGDNDTGLYYPTDQRVFDNLTGNPLSPIETPGINPLDDAGFQGWENMDIDQFLEALDAGTFAGFFDP